MKKLLSVVLACAMLFTMVLPMSVFAAGDVTIGDSAVEINWGDYVNTNCNPAKVRVVAETSGLTSVRSFWSVTPNEQTLATLTVDVVASGYYDVEFVSTIPGPEMGSYQVMLNDTVLATTSDSTLVEDVTASYPEALGAYWGEGITGLQMGRYRKGGVFIEAGQYTLSAYIPRMFNDVYYRAYAATVKFAPVAGDVTIGDSEVEISWGDYLNTNCDPSKVRVITEASGLTSIRSFWSTTSNEQTLATLTVDVAASGYYDVEFVSTVTGPAMGSYQVMLNDTVLATTSDSTLVEDVTASYPDALGNYWGEGYTGLQMGRYRKEKVQIEAGQYTLTAYIPFMFNGENYRAYAATVKFTPVDGDPTDPVISSATFKVGNDGVVTPSYVFTSPSGKEDALTFILKYDGADVGSFVYGDEIRVPDDVKDDSDYDKTKVSLEAIAKDEEDNVVAVIKFVYIDMTASYDEGAVTPKLTIVKGSSNFNGVLLVAFYDTNEAGDKYLLKIEQKHIEVTTDVPYELLDWSAETAVRDEDYTGVVPKSAEVYLLGCKASTAEQKANPIIHTTLEELAYVGDITFGQH